MIVGQTPTGIITDRHDTGRFDPNFLWVNRRGLDSVNHCTMGEYVEARMNGGSTSHCHGRYRRAAPSTPSIEDRIASSGGVSGATSQTPGAQTFTDDFRSASPAGTGGDAPTAPLTSGAGSVATVDQAQQAQDRRDREAATEAGRRGAADARRDADRIATQAERDRIADANTDQQADASDRLTSAQAAGAAAVAAEAARPPPGMPDVVFTDRLDDLSGERDRIRDERTAILTGQPVPGRAPMSPRTDPCAYDFLDAALNCRCTGYRYDPSVGACTSGGTGGGTSAVDDVLAGRDAGPGFDSRTAQCDAAVQSGADTPASITMNTGGRGGRAELYYETYDIKDRIWVVAGNRQIFDSGCVGAEETIAIDLPFGMPVKVVVQPNCAGTSGTNWNFKLSCPQ